MADTDINAVLDRIEGAQHTPAAPEPTTTAPDPASAASEATAPDPAASEGGPPATATIEGLWKKIKDLRKESGGYRSERNTARDELGRYTTAFDGLDEQARDSILAIPAYLKGGPEKQAELASWLRAQADGLTVAEQQELAEQVEDAAEAKGAPLTAAAIEKMVNDKLAERDQQTAIDNEVGVIRKQVEAFGVQWESPKSTAILSIAASHYNGDITKAYYEVMASWAQESVDEFVAARKADAANPTPTPTSGGAAGAAPGPLGGIKGASKGVDGWLAAQGMK